jgi:hypothetical protein
MGPLAGRGEGYQPIGAPPATGQTTLQLKGGTGQVTNPESTQRPGEIRMSNLKPLSDATLTTPTGVQMGTGEYGGKPFNYGGYMSDAGPKEMNVPGGATERQNIAQAPGGGLIGTSPSGGYMIGATEGNKMPLSPTSPQGQQALASAGLGTNTTQGAQRTAATQESGEALPPDPHRRRAF